MNRVVFALLLSACGPVPERDLDVPTELEQDLCARGVVVLAEQALVDGARVEVCGKCGGESAVLQSYGREGHTLIADVSFFWADGQQDVWVGIRRQGGLVSEAWVPYTDGSAELRIFSAGTFGNYVFSVMCMDSTSVYWHAQLTYDRRWRENQK